jgi:hypothetical protein
MESMEQVSSLVAPYITCINTVAVNNSVSDARRVIFKLCYDTHCHWVVRGKLGRVLRMNGRVVGAASCRATAESGHGANNLHKPDAALVFVETQLEMSCHKVSAYTRLQQMP